MHSDKFRSARPPLTGATTEAPGPTPTDPVLRAAQRIRSVDVEGSETSDDTIDADAKGIEAAKNLSQWQDNVVYSDATLVNGYPTLDPTAPIAGIDSRPDHGRPLIATTAGQRVVLLGVVHVAGRNGSRVAQRFTLESDAPADKPR